MRLVQIPFRRKKKCIPSHAPAAAGSRSPRPAFEKSRWRARRGRPPPQSPPAVIGFASAPVSRSPATPASFTGGELTTVSRCCCACRICSAGTSTTSARPTLRSSHWSRIGRCTRISICIHKRPPLPAIFIRSQRQHAVSEPRHSEMAPVPIAPTGVFPSAVTVSGSETGRPPAARARFGIGESPVNTTSGPTARPLSTGQSALHERRQRRNHRRRRQRGSIVKMHPRPQPKLPAMISCHPIPSHASAGCTVPLASS